MKLRLIFKQNHFYFSNFRKYNEKKLKSNIECEIFETILNEAKDSYDPDIVHELNGNNDKDFKTNVTTIRQWIKENKS